MDFARSTDKQNAPCDPSMLSSSSIKSLLRRRLAPDQIERLKKTHRRGQKVWTRTVHPRDLRRIGLMFWVRKYDWY
jgi:hypothetical protein